MTHEEYWRRLVHRWLRLRQMEEQRALEERGASGGGVSLSPGVPPGVPTGLAAVGGTGYVLVNGTLSGSTTMVNVRRAPFGTTSWVTPTGGTGVLVASLPFVDVDQLAGNYIYQLQAVNGAGQSVFSASSNSASPYIVYDQTTDTNGTTPAAHAIAPVNTGSLSWANITTAPQVTSNRFVTQASGGASINSAQGVVTIQCTMQMPVVGTANGDFSLFGRYENATNHFYLYLANVGGTDQQLLLTEIKAGTQTTMATAPLQAVFVGGADVTVSLTVNNTTGLITANLNGQTCSYASADLNTFTAVAFQSDFASVQSTNISIISGTGNSPATGWRHGHACSWRRLDQRSNGTRGL